MENSIRIIFWVVFGLIWFVSALSKKRRMETQHIPVRKVGETAPRMGETTLKVGETNHGAGEAKPEGVYEAPEDELSRFLKMISGEVQQKKKEIKPGPYLQPVSQVKPQVVETREVKPEPEEIESLLELKPIPEIESPPDAGPVHIEPEEIQEAVVEKHPEVAGEIPKIGKKMFIAPVARMGVSDLQRAIVLSEILGLPRAMKPFTGDISSVNPVSF